MTPTRAAEFGAKKNNGRHNGTHCIGAAGNQKMCHTSFVSCQTCHLVRSQFWAGR